MNRLVALALMVPGLATAQEFDYNFIEFAFLDTEIDAGPVDIDGDGFALSGSYAIADNMYVIAGYSDSDYDFGLDGTLLNLGVGFYTGLKEDLDFVADLSYLDAEVAGSGGSVDEDGYSIRAGVRARINPSLELEGGLVLIDLTDSDTGFRGTARYYFNDEFAVFGSLQDIDNETSFNIGVRYEFGDL